MVLNLPKGNNLLEITDMIFNKGIKYLMDKPFLYRVVQNVLAGRGHKAIKKYLNRQIPKGIKSVLDQGCGTGEYALLFGKKYTGIDNNPRDIKFAQNNYPGHFFCGSATEIPFKSESFNIVFTVGLHHHLNDKEARQAIKESFRVLKRNGKLVIVDAMYPKNPLNIIGLFLRKIDRGKYVRDYRDTLNLFTSSPVENVNIKYEILSSFPFNYIAIIGRKLT